MDSELDVGLFFVVLVHVLRFHAPRNSMHRAIKEEKGTEPKPPAGRLCGLLYLPPWVPFSSWVSLLWARVAQTPGPYLPGACVSVRRNARVRWCERSLVSGSSVCVRVCGGDGGGGWVGVTIKRHFDLILADCIKEPAVSGRRSEEHIVPRGKSPRTM